nr:hypothetical protein [Actinomycetales bacterium]
MNTPRHAARESLAHHNSLAERARTALTYWRAGVVKRSRTRLNHLRRHAERGSVSMFAVVSVLGLFIAIGLVVDGGRKIRAIETAQAIAQDAARVAGNQLDFTSNLLDGSRPEIDVDAAISAGNAAIATAGGDPSSPGVSVSGYTVSATVHVTVPTTFLSVIGIASVTGVGEVGGVEPVPGMNAEIP